jgi:hypothetical protein
VFEEFRNRSQEQESSSQERCGVSLETALPLLPNPGPQGSTFLLTGFEFPQGREALASVPLVLCCARIPH